MLVDPYFFEFAIFAELHCNNIHSPCALRAGMQVEIIGSHLHYFSLFTQRHRLFREAVAAPSARFYLHKDEIMLILSYQVDLTMRAAKVLLQDVISPARECFCCQAFTHSAKTLTSRFWFILRTGATVCCVLLHNYNTALYSSVL